MERSTEIELFSRMLASLGRIEALLTAANVNAERRLELAERSDEALAQFDTVGDEIRANIQATTARLNDALSERQMAEPAARDEALNGELNIPTLGRIGIDNPANLF